jgi:hypothetical protein
MSSSICHILSAIMVSQKPLSLREGPSLWHVFGSNYITIWALILSEVQSIILRLADILSRSIKSSKICFVLVF